jgi:hypothetical protein
MQTFVVRVWTPASAPPTAGDREVLRGVVEHPVTGDNETFATEDELLAFLRKHSSLVATGRGQGEAP